MFKRIRIYLKEMYPFWSRWLVAFGLFFTIYFLIIALSGVKNFHIGGQEFIAVLAIFTFLMSLRIADEFKDYDTDKKNFPERPLPSGRVKKSDLITLLLTFQIPTIVLNLVFMNNLCWFLGLWTYGIVMSFWFFAKKWIKPNLILALITHNPVTLLLNLYLVSFICTKYNLDMFTPNIILVAVALYLPGLVYEIGRKVRAPRKETAYKTYSKIIGYKPAIWLVVVLKFICTAINTVLVASLSIVVLIGLWLLFAYVLNESWHLTQDPKRTPFIKVVTAFIYCEQALLMIAALMFIWTGRII